MKNFMLKKLLISGIVVLLFTVCVWWFSNFIMAMILMGAWIVALFLLEIMPNIIFSGTEELKFVERREATINWDDAHVFCRDKSGKIYTINNPRNELNVAYKSHNISKNIGNGANVTTEEIIQVIEEGDAAFVEIYEGRKECIFRKKVHKRYKIIIPLSTLKE